MFNMNNNKKEDVTDKILFLIVKGVVKFRISRRIYADPAMHAGIISIITLEFSMIVALLINTELKNNFNISAEKNRVIFVKNL